MIFKVHIQYFSHIGQGSVCSVEQIVFANVILWLYPLSLEYSPKCFREIQMWRVWWKKEDEKSSLFPKLAMAHDFLSPMNLCVIKHDNGLFPDAKRQAVKIFDDSLSVDGFCCSKPVIIGVPVDDAKAIEPEFLIGRDVTVLPLKLPPIRHIAAGTYMGFISVIKIYETSCILIFKFLKLLALVRIELRRGLSPWTFSYTFISCAKADKKRLNVSSEDVLPEDASHAAFAAFTLCRSASMAWRIVFSSASLLMIGLAPCPGRFSNPEMPSAMNRSTHLLMDCCHKSTFPAIFGELKPWDFNSTHRQRWGRKCARPCLYPFSRTRICSADKSISFVFPILIFAISIGITHKEAKYYHLNLFC